MNHRSFNHVRIYRQRNALSESELAKLLGRKRGKAVEALEYGEREPTFETAIALQIVFGAAPRELFPGLYEAIETAVMRRRQTLLKALDGRNDSRSGTKRALLEGMPARSLANTIEA